MKRLAAFFCLVLLLSAGCAAPKKPCPLLPWDAWGTVADVERLPQDPEFYAKRLKAWSAPSPEDMQQAAQNCRTRFFAPWRQEKSGYAPDQALWALQAYGGKQGYGENLRPRDREWFQRLVRDVNASAFPSLAHRAVAVQNTSLRSMPTSRPFFYDPRDAGEGYPFDYFQNSALWAGTPVFISHQTADGSWLYAEAPFAAGWVPARDLAMVDAAFIEQYATPPLVAVTRDTTPAHDSHGTFLFSAHVGALFPAAASQGGPAQAILAPVSDASGRAVAVRASLPPEAASPFPLPFTPLRVAELARQFVGQPYGWGGMYENRDCSAMTRDLLLPFGVWLARNSKPQAKQGVHISLQGLSPQQKEERLLQEGVPFRTLVGQPGHIMFYLGAYKGRAMLLHNIWGLRTEDVCGRAGRQIIGRGVITTLTPGSEFDAVQRSGYSLQKRIDSLAILP